MLTFFKSLYKRPALLLYIATYLSLITIFFTGFSKEALIVCFVIVALNMWAVTAGYHRYFSHKSYSTSRVFQFILAFLAQMSTQNGALWWAEKHRIHHANSDTENDVHSPRQKGFFYSHIGWVFSSNRNFEYKYVGDLKKYPELVWLDKYEMIPTYLLALIVFLLVGIQGFVIGFCLSRVLAWNITYTINSLAHTFGSQRYETEDDSRNNFWLALITFGEGWHNNHHHYASSCRQGFYWWEIDFTYYSLVLLSWLGIVWNLKQPPPHILVKNLKKPITVEKPPAIKQAIIVKQPVLVRKQQSSKIANL